MNNIIFAAALMSLTLAGCGTANMPVAPNALTSSGMTAQSASNRLSSVSLQRATLIVNKLLGTNQADNQTHVTGLTFNATPLANVLQFNAELVVTNVGGMNFSSHTSGLVNIQTGTVSNVTRTAMR